MSAIKDFKAALAAKLEKMSLQSETPEPDKP
jgi:hypothetical protein